MPRISRITIQIRVSAQEIEAYSGKFPHRRADPTTWAAVLAGRHLANLRNAHLEYIEPIGAPHPVAYRITYELSPELESLRRPGWVVRLWRRLFPHA